MACHSAVRAGDHLTVAEMESIIQQLADTHDPHTCPHGRPTSLQLKTATSSWNSAALTNHQTPDAGIPTRSYGSAGCQTSHPDLLAP